MKSKKKALIVFILIIVTLIIVCCSITLINKNKVKHIYDENAHIRGLTKISVKSHVCQALKEIYGELPKEDKDGNPYEVIENFDNIDTCTATVMYIIDKKYKMLKCVTINLNSTKYSSDELYDIILKNLEKMYGEQPIRKDDRGETMYDKKTGEPIAGQWYIGSRYIHLDKNETSSYDGNLYQVIIDFH